MMIYTNTLNYSTSGRKRKTVKSKKIKKQPEFRAMVARNLPVGYKDSKEYPSACITPYKEGEDTSYKKEVSSNYTVSVAYNKGAYQVISNDNIKHIGK